MQWYMHVHDVQDLDVHVPSHDAPPSCCSAALEDTEDCLVGKEDLSSGGKTAKLSGSARGTEDLRAVGFRYCFAPLCHIAYISPCAACRLAALLRHHFCASILGLLQHCEHVLILANPCMNSQHLFPVVLALYSCNLSQCISFALSRVILLSQVNWTKHVNHMLICAGL